MLTVRSLVNALKIPSTYRLTIYDLDTKANIYNANAKNVLLEDAAEFQIEEISLFEKNFTTPTILLKVHSAVINQR